MSDALVLESFADVADLVIILTAIGLLLFALGRGWLRANYFPQYGGVLILAGALLAVLAHIGEVAFEYLLGNGSGSAGLASSTFLSAVQVHWLLTRFGLAMFVVGVLIAVSTRKKVEGEFLDTQRELSVSKYFEYQAEERFRYLFDSTSNAVYCYNFDPPMPTDLPVEKQVQRSYDAVLQDCNVVFARELDADDPSEVIGSRFGDLDSARDTASHEAYFRTFIEGDYRLNGYELDYKTPMGEKRALQINMVGILHDGLLHRMWAVENNVLDLQQTKALLRRRQQFQALVASVSTRLVMASDQMAEAVIEDCMRSVCEFAKVDRLTLFSLDNSQESIAAAYVVSPENYSFESFSMDEYPGIRTHLRTMQPVRLDDVSSVPEDYKVDQASLEKHGLKSALVLPTIATGETIGGLTCGMVSEQRAWTDQEVADLKVFGELFANFVLRLNFMRSLSEAMTRLQQATERLEAENVYLREEIEVTHGFDEIIGQSGAVLRSLRLVEQVAPTKTPVLILGETGTGKELVARAIHELSDRCDRPLVKVNCAALPANLIESELFGHEKGAFTGADNAKRGRFDLADGSTLFLDEIGEIPIELQAKLLRVLQEGEFDRLGGGKTIKVDVRLVVATNRDLSVSVKEGEFRSDLYYRINTFPIELPALRDRGDDIQILAEHFVNVHAPHLGREVKEISSEMMDQLRRYPWPGNVRELEGIVQRALISSSGLVLNLAAPLVYDAEDQETEIISTTISDLKLVERDHILSVLERADWKISGESGAASKLGIPPSTLRSKMKKLSIVRPH